MISRRRKASGQRLTLQGQIIKKAVVGEARWLLTNKSLSASIPRAKASEHLLDARTGRRDRVTDAIFIADGTNEKSVRPLRQLPEPPCAIFSPAKSPVRIRAYTSLVVVRQSSATCKLLEVKVIDRLTQWIGIFRKSNLQNGLNGSACPSTPAKSPEIRNFYTTQKPSAPRTERCETRNCLAPHSYKWPRRTSDHDPPETGGAPDNPGTFVGHRSTNLRSA